MSETNRTKAQASVGNRKDFIDDELRTLLLAINFSYICQLIDLFGAGTNILNIMCFLRQGFRDAVNISFFALAISDLLCLLFLIWNNLCLNPLFYDQPFIYFDAFDIVYVTAGWPHTVFARISACLTAFITTERCVCVVLPLQVKTIMTRRRVIITIACIYIILIGSVSPVYYCNRFSWKFYKYANKNRLQIDGTSDRELIESITFAINYVALPCLTFLVVIVTTAMLVMKLKEKTTWRMASAASGQSSAMFQRDQKLSKMVIVMASVFIACYGPVCVIFTAMIIEPELSLYGTFKNLFGVVFSVAYIIESMSVSMNIFIYYRMSGRFKAIVIDMFSLGKHAESDRSQKGKK